MLESTGIEARILPVSGATGEGVAGLLDALDELVEGAGHVHPERNISRLPVDRAFVLKGIGVVVTGTLWSGGDESGGGALHRVRVPSQGTWTTEPRSARRGRPRRLPNGPGSGGRRSESDPGRRGSALAARQGKAGFSTSGSAFRRAQSRWRAASGCDCITAPGIPTPGSACLNLAN